MLDIYKDDEGLWNWAIKSSDDEIICESSESFTSKVLALTNLFRVYQQIQIEIARLHNQDSLVYEKEERKQDNE